MRVWTERNIHVLRGHLNLVLAEREKTTERDVGRRDEVLAGREQLEVVSLLQDRAVVRRYVQAALTIPRQLAPRE